MKTRIIASILVILVVGALLFISEVGSNTTGTPVINQPANNDAALKALSL
jgi:hypothetical protein